MITIMKTLVVLSEQAAMLNGKPKELVLRKDEYELLKQRGQFWVHRGFKKCRVTLSKNAKEVTLNEFSCGYCKFEGVVSETSDWTRCPNCGGL